MKRTKVIAVLLAMLLLVIQLPITVFAAELIPAQYLLVHYADAESSNGIATSKYKVLVRDDVLYMSSGDLCLVAGWELNQVEFLTKPEIDDAFQIALKKTTLLIFTETAEARYLGVKYALAGVVKQDNEIYLPLEQTLYLMGVAWCVGNDGCLYMTRSSTTLLDLCDDMIPSFLRYRMASRLTFVKEGDSELGIAANNTLVRVFSDFDFRWMLPGIGTESLMADDYTEALLSITPIPDFTKGMETDIEDIQNYIEDSGYQSSGIKEQAQFLSSALACGEGTYTLSETIDLVQLWSEQGSPITQIGLTKAVSESWDALLDSSGIAVLNSKTGDFLDMLQIAIEVGEVYSHSKALTEADIVDLKMLRDCLDSTSKEDIKSKDSFSALYSAVNGLILEKENDHLAAAKKATIGGTTVAIEKVVQSHPVTRIPYTVIKGAFSASGLVMNTLLTDTVKKSETCRVGWSIVDISNAAYVQYLNVLCLMLNGAPQAAYSEQDVIELGGYPEVLACLRSAISLMIRSSMSAKYYALQYKSDGVWENGEEAKLMRDSIAYHYALLFMLNDTKATDKLVPRGNQFSELYADGLRCPVPQELLSDDPAIVVEIEDGTKVLADEQLNQHLNKLVDDENIWRYYTSDWTGFDLHEAWFQDIDFDGINELVVGGYSGGSDHSTCYKVLKYIGDSLEEVVQFRGGIELCRRVSSKRFVYWNVEDYRISAASSGVAIDIIDGFTRTRVGNETIVYGDEWTTMTGEKSCWYNAEYKEITEDEYYALCNSYAEDLIRYSYTTESFSLTDYDKLTRTEKLEKLKQSYEAFSVGEEIGPMFAEADLKPES